MGNISYGEILYASTEKSCISGSAGFGIRALNSHITPDEAEKIVSGLGFTYDLPTSRKVRFAQIQEDPAVTTRYPRTYLFQKLKLAEGVERWIVACATYIGIDYGYFCGKEQYQRVGSNYIADYVVFDRFPGAIIFQVVGDGHTFEPLDNTCSPDNKELQRLLTGDPTPLVDEEVVVDVPPLQIDRHFAQLVKALTQAYINRSIGRDEKLTKVIVRAQDAETAALVQKMQYLPGPLMEDMTFQTNYLEGYGVPTSLNMVFVNEYNKEEMYEQDYVTIDLMNGKACNLDDNFLYHIIDQFTEKSDSATVLDLLHFLVKMKLTAETDYEFIYKLYKINRKPELGLSYAELTPDFFNKLRALGLSADQLENSKKLINQLINSSLTAADASIDDALKLVDRMRKSDPALLALTKESRQHLADLLFNRERQLSAYLAKGYSAELLTYIIQDANYIEGYESLFPALQEVGKREIWKHCIDFYHGGVADMNKLIPLICGQVIAAPKMNGGDKEALIREYYPLQQYGQKLFNYIVQKVQSQDELPIPETTVEQRIVTLKGIVEDLCRKATPDVFATLIHAADDSGQVLRQLGLVLSQYFKSEDDETFSSLLTQIQAIGVAQFQQMGASGLLDNYVRRSFNKPTGEKNAANLKAMAGLGVQLSPATEQDGNLLLNMYARSTTLPKLTIREMLLLKRLPGLDNEYLKELFKVWIQKLPSVEDVARFVSTDPAISVPVSKELLKLAWKEGKGYRSEYVLSVIDAARWSGSDRKAFMQETTSEVAQVIQKEYVWWRVLLRKVLKKK